MFWRVWAVLGPVVLVDGTGQVLTECSECVHGWCECVHGCCDCVHLVVRMCSRSVANMLT